MRLLEPIVIGTVEAYVIEHEREVLRLKCAAAACGEVSDTTVEHTLRVPIVVVILNYAEGLKVGLMTAATSGSHTTVRILSGPVVR